MIGNLHNAALSIQKKQVVGWYKFNRRDINEIGLDVAVYDPEVFLTGSLQPVAKNLYQQYGLDLSKIYVTFYSATRLLDVTRDVSGDQISFKGRRYQCLSLNDWFDYGGWIGILCVDVGNG